MATQAERPAWIDDYPELADVWDQWVKRDLIPIDEFNALAQEFKTEAFSALGAANEKMLGKVRDLIAEAMTGQWTGKEVIRAIDETLSIPWYWDMVFRTNVTNAFMGGHYSAMFGPIGADYPVFQFVGPADSRNDEEDECPGLICRAMLNRYFSKDDFEARRRLPPTHWQCRHSARDVPAEEAANVDLTDASEMPEPDPDWDFDKRDLIPASMRG